MFARIICVSTLLICVTAAQSYASNRDEIRLDADGFKIPTREMAQQARIRRQKADAKQRTHKISDQQTLKGSRPHLQRQKSSSLNQDSHKDTRHKDTMIVPFTKASSSSFNTPLLKTKGPDAAPELQKFCGLSKKSPVQKYASPKAKGKPTLTKGAAFYIKGNDTDITDAFLRALFPPPPIPVMNNPSMAIKGPSA